jgi:hypothetical protein
MVKKHIFKFGTCPNPGGAETSEADMLHMNDNLHMYLNNQKNDITYHHQKHKWEKYKKMSNDFELVHSTNHTFPSISSMSPISRSYFKLWEILVDMNSELNMQTTSPRRCAYLADAPGGFVQATLHYRKKYVCGTPEEDRHFAVSLKPTNALVPHWKLSPRFCKENNVSLYTETSGDICNHNVLASFVDVVGKGTCDFVTADGGFDFSSDFNNQETMCTRLVLAEIYGILLLQREGGACVLKLYDIHNATTIRALFVLYSMYDNMYAYKPMSSRPANSEKYIVASGFKGVCSADNAVLELLQKAVAKGSDLDIDVPQHFLESVLHFNTYYVANQIASIGKTIHFIVQEKKQEEVLHTQLRKAIKWCHKYGIAINAESLKRYRKLVGFGQTSKDDA